MADQEQLTRGRQSFVAAKHLYDKGDVGGGIAAAKTNLRDPALPSVWVVRNCHLIASATDDRKEADVWRRRGERAFMLALRKAIESQDKHALEVVKSLRPELRAVERTVELKRPLATSDQVTGNTVDVDKREIHRKEEDNPSSLDAGWEIVDAEKEFEWSELLFDAEASDVLD